MLFLVAVLFYCLRDVCNAACIQPSERPTGQSSTFVELYSVNARSKLTISDDGDVILVPWEKAAGKDLRLEWWPMFLGRNNFARAFSSKANSDRYLSINGTGHVTTTEGVGNRL